jgi:ABC-2 type transport system ATP-binding protein
MLAIEAHGLRKVYNGTVAVDSLDVSVEPGTIVGFLGPNGAGKTSAIRVLCTVLRADGGTFSVAGVPHTRPTEIRRRVGVLPESAGYPGGQTGEEWLAYHGQLFGLSGREAMATGRRLLGEVGLGERGRSRISEMSRGMRQRLGIARALVNDPQVVFLDEPTLGLDPAGQRQVLGLVSRISRERGSTVVLSTHLLTEVEQVCDRVLILDRGRLVSDGTVAEVVRDAVTRPAHGMLRVPPDDQERALEVLQGGGIDAAVAEEGQLSEAFLALTDRDRGAP